MDNLLNTGLGKSPPSEFGVVDELEKVTDEFIKSWNTSGRKLTWIKDVKQIPFSIDKAKNFRQSIKGGIPARVHTN